MFHFPAAAIQVYMGACVAQCCSAQFLEQKLVDQRRRNPDLDDAEIVRRLAKSPTLRKVPGSSAYYKNALLDLLAMVKEFGMPHFFLTLTMDDASDMRWHEVSDFQSILDSFCGNLNHTDMGVEMAMLFHNRLTNFMQQYILPSSGGLLGRVQHHVTRYESQVRCQKIVSSDVTIISQLLPDE
jgi:hypothetical protein